MGSITNSVQKRLKSAVNSKAEQMLDKLQNKSGHNLNTVCFPADLKNQAQCTYMVIYVLDNTQNNQTFSPTMFNSQVSKDSYEIPAITFLKDYAKQELDRLKAGAKDELNGVVKDAKDVFTTWAKGEIDITTGLEIKTIEHQIKEYGSWANTWLVPQRVVSESKALSDALDPLKMVPSGYQLTQAFAIQMPSSSLTYNYQNGWESVDTSTLRAIQSLVGGLENLLTGKGTEVAKAKQQLGDVGTLVTDAIGDLLTGGGYSASEKEKERRVTNPVLSYNYTLPKPRTFTHSFSLYPRNKEELYTLFNMIQMLKFYALPITGSADPTHKNRITFYQYPAQFVIRFYTNGYENLWFPKTLNLGLTSISETLTGEDGDMAFFENYFDKESGNPPRYVKLTLQFTELAILGREYAQLGC